MKKLTLPYRAPGWTTAPINATCEVCDGPTSYAYPAHGGGWMALCRAHGKKHLPHAFMIEELIESGEKFS